MNKNQILEVVSTLTTTEKSWLRSHILGTRPEDLPDESRQAQLTDLLLSYNGFPQEAKAEVKAALESVGVDTSLPEMKNTRLKIPMRGN